MSTLNKIPSRGIIHTKDIQNITGFKTAASTKLLRRIRSQLNKPRGALVTIPEFCFCTGLDEEFVKEFIQ